VQIKGDAKPYQIRMWNGDCTLQKKFNKRRHYHPEMVQLNGTNLLEIKLLAEQKENSRGLRFFHVN